MGVCAMRLPLKWVLYFMFTKCYCKVRFISKHPAAYQGLWVKLDDAWGEKREPALFWAEETPQTGLEGADVFESLQCVARGGGLARRPC